MAQEKENIWVEINEAMTEIWPLIQIIFLARRANKEIKRGCCIGKSRFRTKAW